MLSGETKHQSEEIKILKISFPWVEIEPTTSGAYSFSLVHLHAWPVFKKNSFFFDSNWKCCIFSDLCQGRAINNEFSLPTKTAYNFEQLLLMLYLIISFSLGVLL